MPSQLSTRQEWLPLVALVGNDGGAVEGEGAIALSDRALRVAEAGVGERPELLGAQLARGRMSSKSSGSSGTKPERR
jgi:hypothetical protein